MKNSGAMFNGISKLADVFFNGRTAEEPQPTVTLQELVKRGKSTVRVGRKYYSIEVKEVTLFAKEKPTK